MIPISKDIILPVPKSNILFVNSLEEFEKIELEPNQSVLGFDNFIQCFYFRSRDRYGEYSVTKIYFYYDFCQKAQNLEREEFEKKCRDAGLDAIKTQMAYMFFVQNLKPQDVWLWLIDNKIKDYEWETVRNIKCKLKKKLFNEMT